MNYCPTLDTFESEKRQYFYLWRNNRHALGLSCEKCMVAYPYASYLLSICLSSIYICFYHQIIVFHKYTTLSLIRAYMLSYIFLIYLLIMLLQLSHFPPFTQLHPVHPLPPTFPPYSSCPWVILISYLASTFPTLFLPSPVYFPPIIYAFYSLYLPPPFPSHSPVDNPPCDLHFCGSVPVLVVCLVCSYFCFRCGH